MASLGPIELTCCFNWSGGNDPNVSQGSGVTTVFRPAGDIYCNTSITIKYFFFQIEIFNDKMQIVKKFRHEEHLGSVCSLNVFHPTRNIIAGGNSSGRVHVFMDWARRAWGPFHQRFCRCIYQSMKISFCSHPCHTEVIGTKFCTWHGSFAAMACAKFCTAMVAHNEVTLR